MRTSTLIVFLATFLILYCAVTSANTQYYLESERDLGNGLKLCIYTEGMTLTVKSHELCPLTVRR